MTTPAQANMGCELEAFNAKKIDCVAYGFYGTPGEKATYTLKTTGFMIAGGNNPVIYGSFTKQGKYKILATIYHNNKKVATKTKTVTVK